METITGTYYKGRLTLDRPFKIKKPIKVLVTLLEEKETMLSISDFSFLESQELLKDCKTSFSDEVIEERRNAL